MGFALLYDIFFVNNPFEDYVILDNWSTYLFLINIVLKY